MKSRINLYLPELQPKLEVLTLSFVLAIWLLTLTIFGVTYYVNDSHNQQVQQELTLLQVQKSQLEDKLIVLNESLTNRTKDPKLLAAIENKQLDVGLKQRVIAELSGQEQFKSNGFAGLMKGLAQHHQDGLWLTRIHLNEQQVMLEGGAIDSSLIPKWVSSLSLTDRFKGQEFSTTRLYRDKDQQLQFTLDTKSTIEPQGNPQP
ncbi:PilN domain-containing protein [Paraglaciecola polaris]|uniref:MSHA biogenesis protein MshI n=1 Tax=Paraglaciecola polaris LMG 21857 TaxID=1129793 RepID=K6ZZD2_9ALTE|nr:PilN domain-containing protein [Paraglaciecola polaris]GAC34103.1 hypothetical protein GPLA_3213 [Paraglaciecola polaris LMG 21857]|tara:strand:+ start:9810 stop:10421 length:612 start_codon:yes stop_codon:yes gene_type:complete